ncbi:uncharacterized protein LOC128675628 [Plodia interpunctella]|uniref:uncharacterized protein LOC128675628 n=1 Tax=Plodia interpunctella TaxID=58824 RepID=UPI002368C5F4|nr:uncharacterized protein LOC128675628 [Plodia interpunctella]
MFARKMSPQYIIFIVLISLACAKSLGSYGRGKSSHTYPHSTGHSGSNVFHSQTTYQTNRGHFYPDSPGLSGSGNKQYGHQTTNVQQKTYHSHTSKTEVHHHYHYNPPPHITYGSQSFPVYHGSPPIYVYQYRDSGSRFDTLLTGLALYNLGKMSAHNHHYDDRRYETRPDEICKLGIRKSNGDYEETRVNCQLMSSFIWETDTANNHVPKTTNTVTTSVMNQTITNINGSVSSVTTTNTTVVDALSAKGPSIQVTPGMTCYLIRTARDFTGMKKTVDCAILQTYAMSSMSRNGSERLTPLLKLFVIGHSVVFILLY